MRELWRILTFRFAAEDIAGLRFSHLMLGLLCVWLVGMGRYWDNPRAELAQRLGIGSLAYVFLLAGLLWLVIKPLRPAHFSYQSVLTFVTLTALPAALYALPVEKWMSLEAADQVNGYFLLLVAAWRVVLLILYLRRVCGFGLMGVVAAAGVPLTGIVVTLTFLNLERAIFDVMGGFAKTTSADDAYAWVVMLMLGAMLASPATLIFWILEWRSDARRPNMTK